MEERTSFAPVYIQGGCGSALKGLTVKPFQWADIGIESYSCTENTGGEQERGFVQTASSTASVGSGAVGYCEGKRGWGCKRVALPSAGYSQICLWIFRNL